MQKVDILWAMCCGHTKHLIVNKQMSDEEEDYMSDKFLAGLQDVRPSLVHNRGTKRQIEVETKKDELKKRQREATIASGKVDNERLQQSLNKPISANNKGFQLLAKMGYKAGSGLGKQPDARTEPVGITMKSGRGGLGREAAVAELTLKRQELRRAHLLSKAGIESHEEISTEAYRKRATLKAEERKLQYDIKRCQQTCESLDVKAGVLEPDLEFFWPPKPKEEDETEDDEEEEEAPKEDQYNPSEQLELLTGYLRTAYSFCYWCGTHYEDAEDLTSNCPGLTRDDH